MKMLLLGKIRQVLSITANNNSMVRTGQVIKWMSTEYTYSAKNLKINKKHSVIYHHCRFYGNILSNTEAQIHPRKHEIMLSYFPVVLKDISEILTKYTSPEDGQNISKILQYVAYDGKKIRGVITEHTYESLTSKKKLSEENLKLTYLLAWSVELLHCSLIMADDIIDNASYRRNKPCWHLVDGVGNSAVNDSFLIQCLVFRFLEKHFGQLDCFEKLRYLLEEYLFYAAVGQYLDHSATNQPTEKFTLDGYQLIVDYKSSYILTYQTVLLGMTFAGIDDREAIVKLKPFLFDLGTFFQIRNDYMDVYMDHQMDIKERKLSWLAAKCIELGTEKQKKTFIKHYGNKDPESVNKVIQVYKEMGLENLYLDYEDNFVNNLIQKAQKSLDDQYLQLISDLISINFKPARLLE